VRQLRISVLVLILGSTVLAGPAWSNPIKDLTGVRATDSSNSSRSGAGTDRGRATEGETRQGKSAATPEKRNERDAAAYRAAMRRYESQMQKYSQCLGMGDVASCPAPPNRPGMPPMGPNGSVTGSLNVPTITGEQAAYIAFARLNLVPPKPVIGPSPDSNPWNMAAVGYPLWLSIDGDPTPPAVSDAVATVHVRLEARVSKVVFHMGDRHSVSCTKLTTTWTRSARGKQSPDCGYTYQKPSLPRGNYTVTATTYWSVAWSTSQDSGTIPFIQSNSTQLPVGELQVLTR